MPLIVSLTSWFFIILLIIPILAPIGMYFLLRNKIQRKVNLGLVLILSYFVGMVIWFFLFMFIAALTNYNGMFEKEESDPHPFMDFPDPITLEDTSVEINKGDSISIRGGILNYQANTKDFKIVTETPEDKVTCSVDISEFTLDSGREKEIEVFIQDNEVVNLGACTLILYLDGVEIDRESIVIEVV